MPCAIHSELARITMRYIFPAFAAAVLFTAALTATAQDTHRGFYTGIELGAAESESIKSTRTNVGIPTNCDQWLPPVNLGGLQLPLPADQCQPRALPASTSKFDLDTGWLAGVQIGYAGLGPFRVEAEYRHRRHGGEKVNLSVPGDPKQKEFSVRNEEIDRLRTDSLFANLYYDFREPVFASWSPYVGAGIGLSRIEIEYSGISTRRDAAALAALNPPRHPAVANQSSIADKTLSDWLWGYQLMAGLDYALGERRTLSTKLRYGSTLGNFRDDGHPWVSLRGHASTVAPGGAPVNYGISTRGQSFWAVSVGLRYHF